MVIDIHLTIKSILGLMTSQCPVKVRQAAFLIEGSRTEFLIADYKSDCFVQITQVLLSQLEVVVAPLNFLVSLTAYNTLI